MRLFLSGGSGFVGQSVLRALLDRGHEVSALLRKPIDAQANLDQTIGDLFDQDALARAMTGCQGAIHLIGIIAENPRKNITFERMHVDATRVVVDAANRCGVRRWIHMSALGSRPDAVSRYHQTKYRAETYVRNHAPGWTIFRPSMIHGPRGEFMQMVAGWAQRRKPPFIFMPYFGSGLFGGGPPRHLQPVYVEDVARAFAEAVTNDTSIGHTYDLAGSEVYTWPEFLRTSARIITGRKRLTLPIPAWYAKLLTHIAPRAWLPFNADQVTMALEDNTGNHSALAEDFGWSPGAFADQLYSYRSEMA